MRYVIGIIATLAILMESPFAFAQSGGLSVEVCVAQGSGRVLCFAAGSKGNAAPVVTLSGTATGILNASEVAFDSASRIYVSDVDTSPPSIRMYAPDADGDVASVAVIAGDNTTLIHPSDLRVDSAGYIYQADAGNGTTATSAWDVFAPIAGLIGTYNVAPLQHCTDAGSNLLFPESIELHGSNVWVTGLGSNSAEEFSGACNSAETPTVTIFGFNTTFDSPGGPRFDPAGNMWFVNVAGADIVEFSAGAGQRGRLSRC